MPSASPSPSTWVSRVKKLFKLPFLSKRENEAVPSSSSESGPVHPKANKNILKMPWKKISGKSQIPEKYPHQSQQQRPRTALGHHDMEYLGMVDSEASSDISSGSSTGGFSAPRDQERRYRLHYGRRIENIELQSLFPGASDEFDKEVAQTTIRSKRMARHLPIARSGRIKKRSDSTLCLSLSPLSPLFPSSLSSPLHSPSLTIRCKTARGTLDAKSPPSTPITPRSFLSVSIKSPTFQRFSTRVGPSSLVSPLKPLSHDVSRVVPPPSSLTLDNVRHMHSIQHRIGRLEHAVPHMLQLHQDQISGISRLYKKHQGLLRRRQEKAGSTPSNDPLPQQSHTKVFRDDVRSPHDLLFTPQAMTFSNWVDHPPVAPTGTAYVVLPKTTSGSKSKSMATSEIVPLNMAKNSMSRQSRLHPGCSRINEIQIRTQEAERLLKEVQERVMSRLEVEAKMRETDKLLRVLETLVAEDWDSKFEDLCYNIKGLSTVEGGREPKSRVGSVRTVELKA